MLRSSPWRSPPDRAAGLPLERTICTPCKSSGRSDAEGDGGAAASSHARTMPPDRGADIGGIAAGTDFAGGRTGRGSAAEAEAHGLGDWRALRLDCSGLLRLFGRNSFRHRLHFRLALGDRSRRWLRRVSLDGGLLDRGRRRSRRRHGPLVYGLALYDLCGLRFRGRLRLRGNRLDLRLGGDRLDLRGRRRWRFFVRRGELGGKGLRSWLRLSGRRLDLRRLCRRCMRFARRSRCRRLRPSPAGGLGTSFGLSRGGSRHGGRLRLILRRCICRRLGAHAHRFGRRRGTCRIDGVGRGRIGHGAGRGRIGRYRGRGGGWRRRCRNPGGPPAIDADGVRAVACRAWQR